MMFAKKISVNCTFSDEYEGNLEQSFTLPLMADFKGIMFDDIAALTPGDTLLKKEMHKRIDSIANDMAFLQGVFGRSCGQQHFNAPGSPTVGGLEVVPCIRV